MFKALACGGSLYYQDWNLPDGCRLPEWQANLYRMHNAAYPDMIRRAILPKRSGVLWTGVAGAQVLWTFAQVPRQPGTWQVFDNGDWKPHAAAFQPWRLYRKI